MFEEKSFRTNEIIRGAEYAVSNFFVRFNLLFNPLLERKQTVIEVRWNLEKLPPSSGEKMEDPAIDRQKPRTFTADRELTVDEQEEFLKTLETVQDIENVFVSFLK